MIFYYGTQISPNQIETAEGYLICRNVPIARTGSMEYTARDLQLDGDPDRVVMVNRYEEDVFEPAALASFEGKSVTDGHPAEEVNAVNYSAYEKGHAENVRRNGDYMVADLYIKDPCLISEIQNGVKREVSCGYVCDYEPDGNNYKQKRIRGNHVAVVHRGRAGANVSIKDEHPEDEHKGGKNIMGMLAKDLLKVFGAAVKDAAPDEMDKMAETTAAMLEAEPAKEAQDAEPVAKTADVMVERAPKGDDLGTKLDKLIEMMSSLVAKEDKEEKKLADESDIDEMIEKLSGAEEEKEESLEDDEAAVTVPAETMADEDKKETVELLKKVRPAVAGIKDKEERARVTDALLSAIKGDNKVNDILAATKSSAAVKARDSRTTYEEKCQAQKTAYDALNPHKKEDK